jgi:hypothetical protein
MYARHMDSSTPFFLPIQDMFIAIDVIADAKVPIRKMKTSAWFAQTFYAIHVLVLPFV